MSVLLIFIAIPINAFALENDSVTVYFYCENPYAVDQSNSESPFNYTYDRNIIVPMQKVTINSVDVSTINNEISANTGYSVSGTDILPVHVFIKALKNMGINPWIYVTWAKDGNGLYTKEINSISSELIERQRTTGTGEKQYFGTTDLLCSVNTNIPTETGKNTIGKYLTLSSLKISDGDVVRMTKRVVGSTALAYSMASQLSRSSNFNVFILSKNEINIDKIEKGDSITLDAFQYDSSGKITEIVARNELDSGRVYLIENNNATLLTGNNNPFELSVGSKNVENGKISIVVSATEQIATGTYLLSFNTKIDNNIMLSSPCDYVIINIGSGSSMADKTNLSSAILSVTGDEAENYYNSDDRYNGKEISINGFWTDMQPILNTAQIVNDSPAATQEEVDTALANLNAAIAKLISKENVNATLLYEEIQEAEALEEAVYTSPSWSNLEDRLSASADMLESLYDDEGNPEDINSIDYQPQVDEVTRRLDEAINGLEYVAGEDIAENAVRAYGDIQDLARFYDPAKMNESDYTPESWEEFINARNAALNWVNSNSQPTKEDSGAKLYELINDVHPAFVYSCHFGLKNQFDSVTVSFKIPNGLAVRAGKAMTGLSGYYNPSMKLDGGKHTLQDAINAASAETGKQLKDATEYEYLKATNATIVFVNGVMYRLLMGNGPLDALNGNIRVNLGDGSPWFYPEDFVLRDGDEVVFAYLQQPSRPSTSGAGYEHYMIDDIVDQIKSSRIMDGSTPASEITVREGENFTLRAESTKAYSQVFGGYTPFSGATIFESGRAEEDSSFIPAVNKTDVVTDSSGSFTHTLYGEGWYTLALYDLRENNYSSKSLYGLTAGDVVKVHVLPAEDPQAVKDSLLEELKEAYEAYDEGYFSVSDWEAMTEAYNDAVSAINSADDLYDARASQLEALSIIINIQEQTSDDNDIKLTGFRAVLERLPEDGSLIDKSVEFLAQELADRYDALSSYQKGRLTGNEANKYQAVREALENGLPEAKAYGISLEFRADTPEAESALKDLMGYVYLNGGINALNINTASVSKRDIDGKDIYNPPESPKRYNLYEVTTSTGITGSVYSTTPAAIQSTTTGSSIYAHSLTMNNGLAYPDNRIDIYPTIQGPAYNFGYVEGNGWIMLDDGPVSEDNVLAKGRTILIEGVPYELKSVAVDGVDKIESRELAVTDLNWEEKGMPYGAVRVLDMGRTFTMPYSDIIITVTWGPVGDSPNPGGDAELAAAKSIAAIAVNNAFSSYTSYEYTDENWAELVNIKNTGLDEISVAESIAAVEAARDRIIADMAAIEKNISQGDIPDFGKVVGTVDLYMENTTFSGGAWTGTILRKTGYEFAENDTMMTVVLRALAEAGFGWTGQGGKEGNVDEYTIEYIASITKNGKSLGEFSGEPGSGWMGTLNDFFVNEGFQQFSYENGKLTDGDEIRIMYTQNLGVDLGGTWGNSDTSLADLKLSTGKLYPLFDSGNYNYTLVMPSSSGRVKVTPTAANRNYLVKTFLNDKVTSRREGSSFYKRTRFIPVRSGDYINIGVGEYAWPSMNNQETEARNYSGTWYRLDIISPDKGSSRVVSLINALPSVKRIDISYENEIKNIRNIYDILTSSEQGNVTNIDKLNEAEARIEFFREIEAVKDLLKKIPTASKVTLKDKQAVVDADAAYKKLTDEQKLYITVGDVKNYNDAIDRLIELGAFSSGSTPSKIVGSDAVPIIEGETIDVQAETKVVNKEATSKVDNKQIKDAIAEAEKAEDVSSITIKADTKEEVTKSTVVVPKSSMAEISEARLDLKVETSVGTMSMPEKVLTEISKQAQGSSVEIVMESMAPEKLTDEQRAVTEGSTVYDISIISSGQSISSFGGQQITISLPYQLKDNQVKENVTVWYINDDGELEKISCTYDEKTGLATFVTDHLSYYAVGYDNSIIFTDVTEDDWFYQSVMFAVDKGLFTGTGESTFSPNMPMTRAMLVTVLHRLEGKPQPSSGTGFIDVASGQWYETSVRWSAEKQIVKGITETEFGPDANITREQLAVILYRYASSKDKAKKVSGAMNEFPDRDKISIWSEDAMKWAAGSGIITGREDKTLDPEGNATRAEVSAMLQRFIENIE